MRNRLSLLATAVAAAVISASCVVAAAPATQPAAYTLPLDQVKYAKGYPVIPPEIRAAAAARDAEWDRLDDEAWKKAEPDVARAALTGHPVIELALHPEDLPRAKIPAFPGAEGGGMYTPGGRGGRVFVVTSLADSGPGTLREAAEAGGPRIVVFNVAGIIHLDRPINVRAPYLTVAGQTAPGDGVCVAGRSFHVNTHDVVVRYLRFRRGNTELADRDDALGGTPIGNVIIDHCSCSWGADETLSIYRQMYPVVPGDSSKRVKLPTVNITIQNTIVSEGLDTYHHAFGGTWGGRNSVFHHNLLACNTGRNASIGMNYDFAFVDNVVFNWRHRTLDGGDNLSLLNVINNYYKPGPATNTNAVRHRIVLLQPKRSKDPKESAVFGKAYVDGNVVEGNDDVTKDNWNGGVQFPPPGFNELSSAELPRDQLRKLIQQTRLESPLPMSPVTIEPAAQAFEHVLATAGATLPKRDPVDARIVEETRTGEVTYEAGKGIITDPAQVGGYPDYKGTPYKDSDHDGMPDEWETAHGLNPNDPGDAVRDANGDGYTNVEKYLNNLDPAQKIDWSDLKNNVDHLHATPAK